MLTGLASCTLGTDPCDDSGGGLSTPWWILALLVLAALAIAAGVVGLLVRPHRGRPWD